MLAPQLAAAQSYPSRPVRVIVGWPAGGTVDGVARVISPRLQQSLGQPVVIENKAGAGGSLAAATLATSAADGYTLLLVFDTHAVNHHLVRDPGYDTFKSFEHISLLVTSPQTLAASTKFPGAGVSDLIALAKAKPGTLNYGSVGTGSSNHLNMLAFESRTGTRMTHVPYKGGAPMMQGLVGAEIDLMFVSAPQAIPQIKGGRIKALASGSMKRMDQLPDVPTVSETVPGFAAASWVGAVAPAGTPREIIARVHSEFALALADPEVKAKLVSQGFEIVGSKPEEFAAFVREESERLGKIIRDNGVKAE